MDAREKVWTYVDLERFPDDGRKYEIFDGELVVSPSPNVAHQRVAKRLFQLLDEQLEKPRIAEVFFAPLDVVLTPTKVFQPDLLAVRWRRRRTAFGERVVEAPPDLAVEVVSSSSRKHDRVRKRQFYARNGVREYWIVDPAERSVEVLELANGRYRQHGWYGPGDRARSAGFDLTFEVDALFTPATKRRRRTAAGARRRR
jgi:Uma2 family endonuclease